MTTRERFLKTLHFEKVDDRLPMVEWAPWWDKTTNNWFKQGLNPDFSGEQILDFFALDKLFVLSGGANSECPFPTIEGGSVITDEASYNKLRPFLFTDKLIENVIAEAEALKERHDRGEVIIRLWLDGFFWFPRVLFGIEGHLFAFYDYPELMHQINSDLADFALRLIDRLFPILKPDMVGFAEDMSYNHGPMLSYELFNEFLVPYYKRVIPVIKEQGVAVLVDSDGDISDMIPWLLEAGLEGVYPLERQAGVDIAEIRKDFPTFLMLGGYDKMVMPLGEAAMRAEFERILPVMKSGGYVPSVDHQTPPGVTLENYMIYCKLFREYCEKATR